MRRRGPLRKEGQLQVVENPVYHSIVGEESDDLHDAAALRADHRINLIDLRGSAEIGNPLVLSRGNLNVEFRMPIGSPEGRYKLRILDNSGKALSAVEKTASKVNGITSFRTPLDTSNLPPGDYRLSIQEPGFAEWTDYPLIVK